MAAKKTKSRKGAGVAKKRAAPDTLRLIIKTAAESTTTNVTATVRAIVKRRVETEPLYRDGKKRRTHSEFLVTIPAITPAESMPAFAFDLAHQVREQSHGAFAWVEPDVVQRPIVAFPDVPSPTELDVANQAEVIGDAVSGLCLEKATPPSDRYWHLRQMNVPQAWEFSAVSGATPRGRGIRIGHLDTGWTTHPELEPSLDLTGQFDFVDDDSNARDELAKGNPFHGSRTGSVIASSFDGQLPASTAPFPRNLSGVAPEAKLVPIRVVESVIVFRNGDVARGIKHAADNDCHVVSMSLGGVGGNALHDAVKFAIAKNVIVCAAAGNCVSMVVWPARYRECIAVAATNANSRPWKGSSRGEAVDIAAPGAQVWTAAKPTPTDPRPVDQGEGTSFAVAGVAGIAALWLAHHGRQTLLNIYAAGGVPLQFVFRHILQKTARDIGLPAGQFGAGFVNAEAVLKCPLPPADQVSTEAATAIGAADSFDAVAGDLLGPVQPVIRNLAVSGLRSGENAAERDLLMQEFAQICFDHPNAHVAYRRGLVLAGTGAAAAGETAALLDAGGIAKYASSRLRGRLTRR